MSCPTPNKKSYRTLDSANQALHDPRLGKTLYSPIRAYECPCGGFHLTAAAKRGGDRCGRSKKNRR